MPLLDWLHKKQAVTAAARVPYRLLDVERVHGDPTADNWLIQGDNLEALKALLPLYAGRVKCIYIDPPYNTRSAFEHYDDNLEHSQWLSMMYLRLELLRELLAEDGSIWVSIDDNEAHYLKVIMDEVFGRGNFVATNVWQKRYSRDNNSAIGDVHDYVFCYAQNAERFKSARNRIEPDAKTRSAYRNPNNDPRGPWRLIPMSGAELRPNQQYPVKTPSGKIMFPPEGRHWSVLEPKFLELVAAGKVFFGKSGDSAPGLIRYFSEIEGLVPWTWWPHEDGGHTDESKKEIHALFGKTDAFSTPKPERLLRRVLEIATNPGDLVLDSFLGSGTTAAVAHKMGRRYIGIEMGEHARSHCLPRLQKVIAGEQGGISPAVGWKGGGGVRFVTLGQPVFLADGRINPEIRFATLAAWVWYQETRTPWEVGAGETAMRGTPLLGVHEGKAVALLYNGILGDRRPQGGNVLTTPVLAALKALLPEHTGAWLVFGESCRLSAQRLAGEGVRFKQIPYDIKAR
ncbi:MAG: site-specific DNA-methyltransferase [Rhodocyclaceae bacterium]|nr:site-specific DNA-methyltransferase [Rhodocyclaceae bacterium]